MTAVTITISGNAMIGVLSFAPTSFDRDIVKSARCFYSDRVVPLVVNAIKINYYKRFN